MAANGTADQRRTRGRAYPPQRQSAAFAYSGTRYARPREAVIHLYELFLELNTLNIAPRRWLRQGPTALLSALTGRFLINFFEQRFEKMYESVQALQEDLDAWLHYYNCERTQWGYRNQGRRPMEIFEIGKGRREEMLKKAA